jgi:hypothetical protein
MQPVPDADSHRALHGLEPLDPQPADGEATKVTWAPDNEPAQENAMTFPSDREDSLATPSPVDL